MKRLLYIFTSLGIVLASSSAAAFAAPAAASDSTDDSGFSVQVSPSPLVASIKPGISTTLDLQIRNTAEHGEDLKMGLRSFSVNNSSGQVNLGKQAPSDVAQFVHFSDPTFTVSAGQIFTQHVIIDTPASAGFTYSFAIVVAQQNPTTAKSGQTALNGSVAIFTLLSVDRPGATSKLGLTSLSVTRHVYEFLPATMTVTFKNSGNTLIQPRGNIFIQRHSDDKQPITTLPLNQSAGYILPGSSRSLSVQWNDGFPHFETVTKPGQADSEHLTWSGGDFSKLRFGRYTAKLVAVYSDNGRDVPLDAEVTFWVIPWRIIGVIALIAALLIIGLITIVRQSTRKIRHKSGKSREKPRSET